MELTEKHMLVSVDQHFTGCDYVIFAAVLCTNQNMQNKLYYETRTIKNKLVMLLTN